MNEKIVNLIYGVLHNSIIIILGIYANIKQPFFPIPEHALIDIYGAEREKSSHISHCGEQFAANSEDW